MQIPSAECGVKGFYVRPLPCLYIWKVLHWLTIGGCSLSLSLLVLGGTKLVLVVFGCSHVTALVVSLDHCYS